ncbi:InlB B-repeat-containing protein [Chitinophagaceae bacterium 26-R-25]|nr:InlB B-repeat-containing protein [Chitinophagaceae bacterium 26-R-25]
MKTSTIKLTLLSIAFITFLGMINACKKNNEEVDKTCKVTFILNQTNAAGDTVNVSATAGLLVQNAPSPVRTGFTFAGWYANSADANPDPTKNTAAPKFPAYDITAKPIYLDVILYARWVK